MPRRLRNLMHQPRVTLCLLLVGLAVVLVASAAQANHTTVPLNTWVSQTTLGYDAGGGGDMRWSYDSTKDNFVMFGHDGHKNCDDCPDGIACCHSCDNYERGGYRRTLWTYSWKTHGWTNQINDTPPSGYPSGRCQAAHAYDPVTGYTFLHGGASSRGTTTQVCPSPSRCHSGENCTGSQTCASGEPCPAGKTYVWGELWRYDPNSNTLVNLAPTPPPNRSEFEWNGNRWMAVNIPGRRLYVVNKNIWGDSTIVNSYNITNNTWTEIDTCVFGATCPNLLTQTNEETATGPLIYDELNDILVLKLNDDTWRFSFATGNWTRSTSTLEPFAHGYIGFTYVKAWGVSVLMGAGTSYNQTWSYNAATDQWTQRAAFPARFQYGGNYHEATYAYSTADNILAVYGNEPGGGDNNPVWVYRLQAVSGDVTIPTVPGSPNATANSSTQITLTWTASTDTGGNLVGYEVYRCSPGVACDPGTAGTQVGNPTASPFVDTLLTPSTLYRYQVRAYDDATNRSAFSTVAQATTQAPPSDTQPPTVPGSPNVTVNSESQLTFAWTASTDNVAVALYRIRWCQGAACDPATGTVTTISSSPFTHSGLSPSTTYRYQVRAEDTAPTPNVSAYTTTVSGTTTAASSFPLNTWVVREMPIYPNGISNTSKHMRLVYDDDRHVVYIHGGDYCLNHADFNFMGGERCASHEIIWEYNVATDTITKLLTQAQASAAGFPRGVCVAGMAWDPVRNVIWRSYGEERNTGSYPPGLVSGEQGLWAFDPTTKLWSREGPGGEGASMQSSNEWMAMHYNPVQDSLWVPASNGGRGSYMGRYNLAGITLRDGVQNDNWTTFNSPTDCPNWEQNAFAIDTVRNRAITYCAYNHTTYAINLTTGTPTTLTTQTLPMVDQFGMVYNSAIDRVVIFGGFDDFQGCTACDVIPTLMLLDPTTNVWSQPVISGNISKRHGDNITYDAFNNVLVIIGGTCCWQEDSSQVDGFGYDGTEIFLVRLASADQTPPQVALTAPGAGATVSGATVTLSATASDDIAVRGVQFKIDTVNVGAEDISSPYSVAWNSFTVPNGPHTVAAVATDTSSLSTTDTRSITVTNVVPTTPTGLSVSAPSGTQVTGSFATVISATGYKIYRCQGAGCSTFVILQDLGPALTFSDTLVSGGTTYRYTVSAYNLVGESAQSAPQTVTTPTATPPATPATFTATATSATLVSFAWTASAGATGYQIKMCAGSLSCSPTAVLLTVGAVTSTSATQLAATQYGYTIVATNGAGASADFSPVRYLTTPALNPPPVPGAFSVVAQSSTSVRGDWTTSAGATGYKAYRCTGPGCTNVTLLQTISSGTTVTFTDSTVNPITTYNYTITATNTDGESAQFSPLRQVQTPAQTCPGAAYSLTPATFDAFWASHTWVPGDVVTLQPGNYDDGLSLGGLNGTELCPIIIKGPDAGAKPAIRGQNGANTVRLSNTSYLTLQRLEVNCQSLDADGVVSQGTSHHITIEDLFIHNCDLDQGYVGINSNFAPTWNWIIRRTEVANCGTGMYLGYPTTAPALAYIVEYNLIRDTIGYNYEHKEMNVLPTTVPGLPLGTTKTIIRYNTFYRATNLGGQARPNLVVGHAPTSGPAAPQENGYEIYGNFFYQNYDEVLFQGAGNIAMYDNLFVNTLASGEPAVLFTFHNGGAPRIIRAFQNTVVNNNPGGILVSGGDTGQTQAAIGNAVFSGSTTVSAGINLQNQTGTYAQASTFLTAPFLAAGSGLNLFPLAGQLSGTTIDTSLLLGFTDYALDFNTTARSPNTFRGAYGASGANPGWAPAVTFQPSRVQLDVLAPAAPSNVRVVP